MKSKSILCIFIATVLYLIFLSSTVWLINEDPKQNHWKFRQKNNQQAIAKLKLEQKQSEILNIMGPPDLTEAKEAKDGLVQILFYKTKTGEKDGITTQKECSGLVFINQKLSAWGDDAYTYYNKIK